MPKDIENEVNEAGLIYQKTIGIIGTAWLVPDFDNGWTESQKRKRVLDIARLLEDEPVLSPKMMTVAKKVILE